MKISDMSLEQLRDYALQLEQEKQANAEKLTQSAQTISELQTLNTTLQKRNNDLFLRVEQQVIPTEVTDTVAEQKPPQSCEDFARNIFKGVLA